MVDCKYCERSFADEEAYLDHLADAHADELGPIDRRRLAEPDSAGLPLGPIALVVVLAVAIAAIAYVTFLSGGGSSSPSVEVARTPHDLWQVHYHGTIEMTVDGQRVDFSRDRYQLQADAFHFESREGTRWHGHARDVTLEYAMATLGIDVTADSVTFEGRTYRNADPGTTVIVEVNGRPVTPSEYVLTEGDHIRIVVRSG